MRWVSRAAVPLLLAACAPRAPAPRPTSLSTARDPAARRESNGSAHRPAAVVSIVIDALAAWEARERLDALPATGGFARLRREGVYAKDVRFAHAALDTAPGHAALYTGATPRENGIVANEVWDDHHERASALLADAEARVVDERGAQGSPSLSARALAVDNVADRLRASDPRATILSLAIKDRGAILPAGHAPTACVWYDRKGDRFVTSTAFASALPAWARERPGPAEALGDRARWSLLDPPWVSAHAATPDAQVGEADLEGLGRTFPHDLARTRDRASAFRATPFADAAVMAMATRALDAAPRDAPLLLAISLSSNDYIGHVFGPDSWEWWDDFRRLDALLASFFAALDARFGADGWAAVLSADHGATRMPEAVGAGAGAIKGVRVSASEIARDAREAARAAGEDPSVIAGVSDPFLYLTPRARALPAARRDALDGAITAALERHPGIARAFVTRSFPSTCPPLTDERLDALVCRSIAPGRGGDYLLVASPGSFFSTDLGGANEGSAHGAPYLSDRSVPLLVRPARGSGAVARHGVGSVVERPIGFASFARTVAALLGVPPPTKMERDPSEIDLTME